MTNELYKKVLISSTEQSIKSAKRNGKLCMKELYLYNLISSFITECDSCSYDHIIIKQLEKTLRDLQNLNKDICNIRHKTLNNSFKFKNKNINNFFGEMATYSLNINKENNSQPSAVGNGSRVTNHATTIVFTISDFTTNTIPQYSDPEGDGAKLLKILSLPADGLLKFNGVEMFTNQIIDFADIGNGLMTYEPDPLLTSARVTPFDFAIADAGSLKFTR